MQTGLLKQSRTIIPVFVRASPLQSAVSQIRSGLFILLFIVNKFFNTYFLLPPLEICCFCLLIRECSQKDHSRYDLMRMYGICMPYLIASTMPNVIPSSPTTTNHTNCWSFQRVSVLSGSNREREEDDIFLVLKLPLQSESECRLNT